MADNTLSPCAAFNLERRPESDRHLAEDLARHTRTDDPLDAVDGLGDLDAAGQDDEQRTFVAFVDGVLAGREADVARDPSHAREVVLRHRLEDRDSRQLFNDDHEVFLGDDLLSRAA